MIDETKNLVNRLGSGILIMLGLYAVCDFFATGQHDSWRLLLGSFSFLAGLDWRFNTHRVMADITIRKQVERDTDMEFTKK